MLVTALVFMSLAQAAQSDAPMPSASADVEADVDRAMRVLAQDPPIAEVQRAAVEYFRVAQNDLNYYRLVSRMRALLPTLSGSYTYSSDGTLVLGNDRIATGIPYDPANPQTTSNSNQVGRNYAVSASWALPGLIFDSSQLDTYALVGINEDLIKEVTRLYYTRQHNMLAFTLAPPGDARARAALIVRTREIEAMMDALTGNAWTKLKTQYRGSAQAANTQGPAVIRRDMPTPAPAAAAGYQPVPPPPPGGASTASRVRR
jgi:hypothetical protein